MRRDLVDVAEVDGAEPFDADVDLLARSLIPAAGDVELLSLWRAAAHKDRVEVVADVQQILEARDRRVVPDLGAHVDDVARLLIEHAFRKAKGRDVEAHQATSARILLVDHDLVAEREEVVGDRERGRTGTDERNPLSVPDCRRLRKVFLDVVPQVRRHSFQAADGDGLSVYPSSPASRLAGSVAGAAEDAREDI